MSACLEWRSFMALKEEVSQVHLEIFLQLITPLSSLSTGTEAEENWEFKTPHQPPAASPRLIPNMTRMKRTGRGRIFDDVLILNVSLSAKKISFQLVNFFPTENCWSALYVLLLSKHCDSGWRALHWLYCLPNRMDWEKWNPDHSRHVMEWSRLPGPSQRIFF